MKGMMKPLYLAAGLLLAAACARPASLADEALDYCVKKVTGVQERLGADYGEKYSVHRQRACHLPRDVT